MKERLFRWSLVAACIGCAVMVAAAPSVPASLRAAGEFLLGACFLACLEDGLK